MPLKSIGALMPGSDYRMFFLSWWSSRQIRTSVLEILATQELAMQVWPWHIVIRVLACWGRKSRNCQSWLSRKNVQVVNYVGGYKSYVLGHVNIVLNLSHYKALSSFLTFDLDPDELPVLHILVFPAHLIPKSKVQGVKTFSFSSTNLSCKVLIKFLPILNNP